MRRLLIVAALLVGACAPRPRYVDDEEGRKDPGPGDHRLVEVDLTSGAPETSAGGLFQLPVTRTYTGLVRALERVLAEPTSAGLFVRLGSQSLDLARSEEMGALFARLRDKGLPVVCHAHGYNNSTTWFAARACSRIWLSAAGSMDTVGIAAELVHIKALLDRLSINADILSLGKYKSGAEPLTREEPSEATLESVASTLGSIRQSWLSGAEQGRPSGIREKLEWGPYSPEEAKREGLIDAVGFESEAREEARRLSKTEFTVTSFGPRARSDGGLDIGELIRILTGGRERTGGRPSIAVIPAEGAITVEAGGPLDSGGITSRSLTRTLQRLRQDDSVKAVVLRIDSPGGSPLASDLIWHELMQLRKRKPVIASVGSMAASGGYYIACGAQKVVAESTSIVGSIGVFGGKIVIGSALDQIGINTFAVPANPEPGAAERSTYLSPFRAWDDATRNRVRANMESIYELFLARVAEGRKIPIEAVRPHAEGRIWSGVQGKERGLIDELGGLQRALEMARQLAGVGPETAVIVEGQRDSLLEMLLIGDGASEAEIRAAVARVEQSRALLARLPSELRTYVGSLAPLLSGEHVVAALPLAVNVR